MVQTPYTHPPAPYSWVLSGYYDQRRQFHTRRRGEDAPDWLLFFTLSGAGRFRQGSEDLIARRGEIFLYAPGAAQDYGIVEPGERWEFLWFHFTGRPDWPVLLKWPAAAPGLLRLKIGDPAEWTRLRDHLWTAHRAASTESRYGKIRAMHSLEAFLIDCAAHLPVVAGTEIDPRIERTIEYVQRNLRLPLTRSVLAQQAGLSLHRFSHLFQEQVGKSPRQFIEEERIKLARHLIESTTASFSEIAADTGYPNLFYFSQRFKTACGMNPSTFRARVKASRPTASSEAHT